MTFSKLFKAIFLLLISIAFTDIGVASPKLEALKAQYHVEAAHNGYHRIFTRKKPSKYGIADSNGNILIRPRSGLMSSVFKCDKVLYGDGWLQRNDYGEQAVNGITNVQVLDVKTGKTIKTLDANVQAPVNRLSNAIRTINIVKKSYVYNLYNVCTDTTKAQGFDHIGNHNEDGYSLARKNEEYTVFDQEGTELLPQRFKKLKNNEYSNSVKIKAGKMTASYDGLAWGVYDIDEQKFVLPAQYQRVDFYSSKLRPSDSQDTEFYQITKNGKANLINVSTGQEMMPAIFDGKNSQIGILHTKNKGTHLLGYFNTGKPSPDELYSNAYNLTAGQFLFPQDLKPRAFKELNNNHWVLHGLNTETIYDLSQQKFIIGSKAMNQYDRIETLEEKHYVVTRLDGAKAIYDYQGTQKTDFKQDMNRFVVRNVEKGGINYPFYMMQKQVSLKEVKRLKRQGKEGNRSFIFGNNQEILLQGTFIINNIRAKEGRLQWREGKVPGKTQSSSRRTGRTCFDTNYKMVNERYYCDIEKEVVVETADVANTPSRVCDANIYKRKPNKTSSAKATASGTVCGSGNRNCYEPKFVIDKNKDTNKMGLGDVWGSDMSSNWLEIKFNFEKRNVEQIEVYTPKQAPISDYILEAKVKSKWVVLDEIKGNRSDFICHTFEPTHIKSVRIRGKKGPSNNSNFVRINEVMVY